MAADDKELIHRCREGDIDAFGVLIDRYEKALFNTALRMVGNFEDARDIAQNTFLKAYEKLRTYDEKYRFFSWIYRIMINESLNLIERRREHAPVADTLVANDPTPDEAFDERLRSERIQVALQELSSDYRSVILMRHFAHLSYQEMGVVLGIPEKTVKSRLYSARRQLGEILLKRGAART